MSRAHKAVAGILALASTACAQWSPQLWQSNGIVAAWTWTDAAGVARTGTVKDGRIYEASAALAERLAAAGLSTNGAAATWYVFERSRLAAYKAAVTSALPYYLDPAGLTNDAPGLPTFDASRLCQRAALPSNYWTYTPWQALGDAATSNGWRGLYRAINCLTVTVASVAWRAHGATNVWGTLADPSGEGATWAAALTDSDVDPVLAYPLDDTAPAAWVRGYNVGTPYYEARWQTGRADATNAAPLANYGKAAALWWAATNWPAYDVVALDAAGSGIGSNAWRVYAAPTNIGTATAWNVPAVGPAGSPLTRAHDGIEPTNNTTWRGFGASGAAVYYWTADTNGFRYR